jgi:hypothetical protein
MKQKSAKGGRRATGRIQVGHSDLRENSLRVEGIVGLTSPLMSKHCANRCATTCPGRSRRLKSWEDRRLEKPDLSSDVLGAGSTATGIRK